MYFMKRLGYTDGKTNNALIIINRIATAVRHDLIFRKMPGLEKYSISVDIIINNEIGTYGPIVEYRLILTRREQNYFADAIAVQHYSSSLAITLSGNSVEELFSDVNRAKLYMLCS